ncbi:hypothetical protein AJ79_02117 [Helicocarpus griseus UAMH5409]|uniref:GAT domain-containing protein n=1 Tax=Helicocarpus griseus UAMH5409 TaxID=1447875 RepID=A0A2B7Y3Y2_9EURO|nr:hypothetical protein AJ79_02117 [Helicocarpus griseus UAMH5409]
MKNILTSLRLLLFSAHSPSSHPPDSPEAIVVAELNAFCESGGPNGKGDEYLHLPAIVEAAESSPGAASEAANQIRKALSNPATKKGYKQYNAVMLIRILVDNPGETFTRNFDTKFVSMIKELLREGRDMSVQQILRETLEFLAVQKSRDTNLAPLTEMWKKEKEKFEKSMGVSAGPWIPPQSTPHAGQRNDYFTRQHRPRGLPSLEELTARISEANTSASLLLQLVQSTPTAEFYSNELLKEFSERCQAAQRSIQGYINATNPAPDEDTMLTLIETNDKLAVAASKYQRAALVARKSMSRTNSQDVVNTTSGQPQQLPQQQQYPSERAGNVEVPTNKRTVPLLSMPRKALSKFRSDKNQEAEDQPQSHYQQPYPQHAPPPRTPPESTARTVTTSSPPSAVSPLVSTPPSLPAITNTATAAPTSNGHANTSSSYQYNSNDFQVENPFADTYRSTQFDSDDERRNDGAAKGAGGADAGADTQPITSSTYYPNSGYSLFDHNMAGAREGDAAAGTGTGTGTGTLTETERFYGSGAARRE